VHANQALKLRMDVKYALDGTLTPLLLLRPKPPRQSPCGTGSGFPGRCGG
jgi:hypothetical protein